MPSFPRLTLTALSLLFALGACEMSPKPDNRIRLMPAANGKGTVAVPPECLNWQSAATAPQDNNPWPQFGCAQARNLAAMVERPEDLETPKPLGPADGVASAISIQNYRVGKTKALIDAKAEAPIMQNPTATPTQ